MLLGLGVTVTASAVSFASAFPEGVMRAEALPRVLLTDAQSGEDQPKVPPFSVHSTLVRPPVLQSCALTGTCCLAGSGTSKGMSVS